MITLSYYEICLGLIYVSIFSFVVFASICSGKKLRVCIDVQSVLWDIHQLLISLLSMYRLQSSVSYSLSSVPPIADNITVLPCSAFQLSFPKQREKKLTPRYPESLGLYFSQLVLLQIRYTILKYVSKSRYFTEYENISNN